MVLPESAEIQEKKEKHTRRLHYHRHPFRSRSPRGLNAPADPAPATPLLHLPSLGRRH
jgi:hypothetical protein